jgi:hypothetical protein
MGSEALPREGSEDDVSEILGLQVLVSEAVERGTLHVIAPAPERADFASDEAYERAYREWWRMANCWTVRNIG